ncbi:hypothetical protein MA16_Dca008987 [Dendrobium catenatum]|uniref:Uncharacterized protein n=1 Tax=Dendrobium catenatum TaxID=906689 RepID=A0A2I0VRA3_9ASPA|nr:hypothetical protein MA16_Dca008987 [Dendrobium catenatum]
MVFKVKLLMPFVLRLDCGKILRSLKFYSAGFWDNASSLCIIFLVAICLIFWCLDFGTMLLYRVIFIAGLSFIVFMRHPTYFWEFVLIPVADAGWDIQVFAGQILHFDQDHLFKVLMENGIFGTMMTKDYINPVTLDGLLATRSMWEVILCTVMVGLAGNQCSCRILNFCGWAACYVM